MNNQLSERKLSQLVKQFLMEVYDTKNAKELEDDHGVKIKKSRGVARNFEFSTSYFYTSQSSTEEFLSIFTEWLRDNYPSQLFTCNHKTIFYNASWPKTSWATLTVKFL